MKRRRSSRWSVGARGRLAGVRRVLLVWQRLEGRRYQPPVTELAQELHVHPRTVKRDIALLEELHFRVPPPLPPRYFASLGAEAARNTSPS